jgi:gamma-glutamylputrescine oxidase
MNQTELPRTNRRKFLKSTVASGAVAIAGAAAVNAVSPSIWKEEMQFSPNGSYWSQALAIPNGPVQQDLDVDTAVIGGGFTGLSTAYYLKLAQPQRRVVLVEASRCGNGASGRNGAMLLTMTEDRYMEWSGEPEIDRKIYDVTVDNIERLKNLSQKTGLDAEIEQNGALQVCNTKEVAEKGRAFGEKARRAGFPFEFWDREQIAGTIGTKVYPGAHFDPNSGQLHPGKLVRVFRSAAESVGVEIYENSPVLHLEPGEPVRITTASGKTVKARNAVLATNAFTSKLGYLRRATSPIMEYVGITRPLSEAKLREIGWSKRIPFNDSRTEVFYLGLTRENRLHIGGGPADYEFNNRVADPPAASRRYARLAEELGRIYPALASEPLELTWSGAVDYSLDGTPSVGHLAGHENIFYGIGFSGHGVNLTSVFGRILADLIQGQAAGWTWLPYLNRLPPYTPNEPFRWLGIQLAMSAVRLTDPATP